MTEQPVKKKKTEFIQPDAYPQMISKRDAIRAMQTLQSAAVQTKAQGAMSSYEPMLRDAILDYVEGMEEAGTDLALIFAMVHEIRGFAQNAGMAATGRIAEILCRYLDEMDRAKKVVDRTIVTLHVAAIGRAARADRDDVKMGHIVADELSALVTRRLAEAGIIR